MRTDFRRFPNRRPVGRLRKLRLLEDSSIYLTAARPLDAVGRGRVEAYCPLAYQLAWKFARYHARDVPVEELIAEALYGLTYAAGMFDETRNVPFGAYAYMVIKHRLIDAVLNWRRARRVGSLPLLLDDETALEPENRPASDVATQTAAQEMCDRVRRVLPARWFHVLRLYYGEGRSLAEVGDRLGLTRQRVQQLVLKARQRVRLFFPEWTKF